VARHANTRYGRMMDVYVCRGVDFEGWNQLLISKKLFKEHAKNNYLNRVDAEERKVEGQSGC